MDDAAKTSGLDDIKKDINGVKTGITAATNPTALGINALDVGLFYRSALDKAEILTDPSLMFKHGAQWCIDGCGIGVEYKFLVKGVRHCQ